MKTKHLLVVGILTFLAASVQAQNLYVSDVGNNTVGEYDARTGAAIAGFTTISGLSAPSGLVLSGNHLYVANQTSNSVGEYDATTGAAIAGWTSPIGLSNPYGLAISGNILYVASNEGIVGVGAYNATTGTPIPGWTSPSGLSRPWGLALAGNHLYVSDAQNSTVGEYDATTGAPIAGWTSPSVSSLSGPTGLALSGNRLYVASYNNGTLDAYDATTGAAIAGFTRPSGLNLPAGVALAGNRLYVANYYGQSVGEYDATTGAVIAGWTSPGFIRPVAVAISAPTVSVQQVSRLPSAPLTTIRQINNNQLEVFTNGPNGQFVSSGAAQQMDSSKPTIVLTHGWNSSPTTFNDLASAIKTQHPDFNVVAWDWSANADTGLLNLGLAESATPGEGAGLGLALSTALGTNYSQPIQFIGHSLGTLVDAEAANVFRSHVTASTAANTQVTLFDDAEKANLAPGATTWLSPIPKQGLSTAGRIDNYISAVGNLHTEARNIILERPFLMNDIDFHGYPMTWYKPTVTGTTIGGGTAPTSAGFNLSITTGVAAGDISNSYYLGSTSGDVTQISSSAAAVLIAPRTIGVVADLLLYTAITGAVQTAGHVLVNLEQQVDPKTQLAVLSPSISLIKHSPSYAWLTISIPADAQRMLFDFKFDNLSVGDWLSVGINDTLLFALESQYLENGQEATSTPLDVTSWDGQNVELFLGLNNVDDANAGGDITVHNLRFETAPEPSTAALLGLVGCFFANRRRRIRE